jgi:hypothetical protein
MPRHVDKKTCRIVALIAPHVVRAKISVIKKIKTVVKTILENIYSPF